MAPKPKSRGKKRVTIQSGHRARFIERTGRSRKVRRIRKKSRRSRQKMRLERAGKLNRIGQDRTHKPTVAELVYEFMQRVSSRSAVRSQKSNAIRQFRKLQRRHPARMTPEFRKRNDDLALTEDVRNNTDREKSQPNVAPPPSSDQKKSIKNCIYEVISFGTAMGFLKPTDKNGYTFRVASDLDLFDKKDGGSTTSRKHVHF